VRDVRRDLAVERFERRDWRRDRRSASEEETVQERGRELEWKRGREV